MASFGHGTNNIFGGPHDTIPITIRRPNGVIAFYEAMICIEMVLEHQRSNSSSRTKTLHEYRIGQLYHTISLNGILN